MRLGLVITSLVGCCATLMACNQGAGGEAKGTPGTVIFRSADGRTLTTEDLRGATGNYRFEVVGEGQVPAEAESLHQQGREAGGRGDYKRALALFNRASKVAPQWPYPVYDTAFTYLLMHDYGAARTYYKKTLELRPCGFFTAITAADTLAREQKGELPVGTYLGYVSLETVDNPTRKAELIRALVKQLPEFAPGWKELASIIDNDDEKLAIVEKGLAAHPDAETKGILEINRAMILNLKGKREEAIRRLGELALDPESTFGTEHLAKASLALLVQERDSKQ
jgi:tetratricopeptide (TPR) repeat protein